MVDSTSLIDSVSSPRISVVMPAYNAEDTIEEAIESILNQEASDFELLVIDDGSTDATPELIQIWEQQDARLIYHRQPHKGITSALNLGLREARGRYIARMDADDISFPNRLQLQSDYLDRNNGVGVISGKVRFKGLEEDYNGYARYVEWVNSLDSENDISLNRFIESPIPHPSVMFRRWIVETLGGYRDGDFPEDYELWLRWMNAGIRFHKLDQVILQWHDHPARLSRNHPRYHRMAFHRIKAYYLSRWLELYNPFHPEVVIWGSARSNRKRAKLLERHGIRITAFVDVNPNKFGQKIHGIPVWSPDELPEAGSCFVIPFVATRGANSDIADVLEAKHYREGIDYLFGA